MRILPALFFVPLLLGSPSLHAGLRLGSVELSPLRVLTLLNAGDVHSMAGGVYFRSTEGTHEPAMPTAMSVQASTWTKPVIRSCAVLSFFTLRLPADRQ